jgi:hypothetical protein
MPDRSGILGDSGSTTATTGVYTEAGDGVVDPTGKESPRRQAKIRETGSVVGETPLSRRAISAMRLKTGAATAPPVSVATPGESIRTRIVKAGSRDGTNPTNDALCSVAE